MKRSTPFFLRTAGLSIVELIMASAVGGVVITATLAAFITLQRSGATYMASSEARANQVRLVEALQRDLRNATSYTLGGGGALPFTMILPGRYSAYESTGNRAGEPKTGTGIRQQVTINPITGKAVATSPATVRFFATNQSGQLVVNREITWTEGGALKTAARPVAQFAPGAAISITEIREPVGQSGGTIVRAATVKVRSAAATQRRGSAPATLEMGETVYLRGKVYTR